MSRPFSIQSFTRISSAITSILDETTLLETVVRSIQENLGFSCVQIFTVHSGRKKVFFQAGITLNGENPYFPGTTFDIENSSEIISKAAREDAIYLNGQVYTIGAHLDEQETQSSQIILPLKFTDQIIGILELRRSYANIDPDEFSILESLGGIIAISMHNAELYKSEKWRREVAESMREVAGQLASTTDLTQLLENILGELENALPIDVAAIWLIDQAATEKLESPLKLNLAAVRLSGMYEAEFKNTEGYFSAEEIMQYYQESDLPSPWLLQAFEKDDALIRRESDPYEPLGAILDFDSNYSAIAATLRVGNVPIGLLSLAHHTAGRYGHEAQNITATFASYAAVAIENTRLYESANDQAWISTVLLQVTEATQSINTLEELLETMAQITPSLIGMNSCAIFLWDEGREIFVPTNAFGYTEAQEAIFKTWWISLGEVPFIDQLYFSKSPVYVEPELDIQEHPLSGQIQETLNYPQQILAAFPMVTRGDILGFFLFSYQENGGSKIGNFKKDIDWEEKYTIIQGIAQQTAVAVENLKLLKAQQEEAYVSVALLQVAQAVVSPSTLKETLETIVRLAPILIGVRRIIVFLWDEEMGCYYSAASYGLSRNDLEDLGPEFLAREFPILDKLRETDQFFFHQVNTVTENPTAWQFIGEDECFWMPFEGGNQPQPVSSGEQGFSSFANQNFRNNHSLIFGFPLSARGKFLGAMITQESAAPTGYLHGRMKRHEISIGIVQQVSMAIQNDQLQHEALERERLEKEFQLAREIQETFLPEKLPEIEGWDLEALWQPARQVSGDFYDIIDLPSGELGIVIADVADKGMPAALFMTLIRTLIRAAVRELNSPATVLQRVNDLLLPDTKHGMFVTVAYFVVNVKSGQVRYANAGHNPPIILKGDQTEHIKLTRTGIALGIFEDIEMEERVCQLEPGDTLYLYTDGITEAFSETEEMFGETRLLDLIVDMPDESLATRLNFIMDTVTQFIGSSNYTDDITLVGLRFLS